MIPQAPRDQNYIPTLMAVSDIDGVTPVLLYADPVTHRLLVDLPSGSGTVTSISVVTANGFAGSVANVTTTPVITLSTTITGVLKGNGTAISAATDGSDYLSSTTGVTLAQGVAQTIGTTSNRVLKLWATDITATNAIAGSITGNSATVTTNANLTGGVTSVGNAATVITNANLTGPITSTGNATAIAAQTGTGTTFVMQGTPTLTTPVLGVATATSLNKVAITQPTTSATLTIADGKTATVNNTLTLAGTDSTTMTFPTTNATIARTDAANTFTGTQTFSNAVINTNNAITASGNAATVPITAKLNTVTNNSAATLTITMTTGAADGQLTIVRILDSSAATQTITWVNTENSTVTAPTTSNGSTTLPLTVGFMYNSATNKFRCVASA